MNQQRIRRFQTAEEAKGLKEKAERNGEKLLDEKAFGSNCITPGESPRSSLAITLIPTSFFAGTPFMAQLSEQMQYFINKKITEDSNWHDVVVFSVREVSGE